ncbi:MAG TPA: ATP synthase F1 subunit delta [Candidatus Kapabacteria bacterium]|nr:ATP synthase F1 subunit delta [Candidatus Kapabacteria bacterium]
MDARIAHRYALALMDIGKEKNSIQKFADDLTLIGETLHSSSELRAMLHSPVVRPDAKHNVLTALFAKHVDADMMKFVDLLVHKGRAGVLPSVVTEFQLLLDEQTNTIGAEITSAAELSDAAKKQIVGKLEQLTKKNVRARFSADPALRGGFVAKVGDTLIDASLQHQLENLREEFKQAAVVRMN